jgi:hypothetical protein
MMLLGHQRGSKFQQLGPIKNKGGRTIKSKLNSKNVIPNAFKKDEICLESLVLIRHLKIGAWEIEELGFGSGRVLQRFEGENNGC